MTQAHSTNPHRRPPDGLTSFQHPGRAAPITWCDTYFLERLDSAMHQQFDEEAREAPGAETATPAGCALGCAAAEPEVDTVRVGSRSTSAEAPAADDIGPHHLVAMLTYGAVDLPCCKCCQVPRSGLPNEPAFGIIVAE